jgi:hypothetical protein
MAIGWSCYGAVEALATTRWQLLLRIQKITLSWLRAFAIVMIGLFFNMYLPGLIGGDAVRLFLCSSKRPGGKRAPNFPLASSGRVGAEFARILFSTRGLLANLLATTNRLISTASGLYH